MEAHSASTSLLSPPDPWTQREPMPLPAPGGPITDWGLSIDAPLELTDPDGHAWTDVADVVVVGLGGAGVQDSPEMMQAYLEAEVGNVVKPETLRAFCQSSAETFEWLRGHGAPFSASMYARKTSYPPLDRFLYHPDSSLAEPFRSHTPPAARGHRTVHRNGKKPWGLGAGIYNPLRAAALAKGLVFHAQAEARQLATDSTGRVIGVRVERLADPAIRARHSRLIAQANRWMSMLSPTFPGARLTFARGFRYLARARTLEEQARTSAWIRARHGVVLSAGGFICNPEMVRHFAPDYAAGLPNGTLGDNGSGIMLGLSAGGATGLMERISAWRFLSPPRAWGQGMLVNGNGARYVNETWYGARIGDAMVERNNGKGWIVLDAALYRQSFKDALGKDVLGFQRDITFANALFAATKAPNPQDLARKLGMDPAALKQTLAAYNAAARGEEADPFGKSPEDMAVLGKGPYYAIDASVDARMFPIACMTVGGLLVEEETGAVRDTEGMVIPGLYAAGRNAVGICSNLYVSGLSYAACIFSGRRAARAIKGSAAVLQEHEQ